MIVLICLLSILSIYLILYYTCVDTNSIYINIYDSHEHVKVIENNIIWTTIAYMDMEPEKILTLKFITQYIRI